MKISKILSDYDPDTFMRIVFSDDMDVSIDIVGKGEFKLAGIGGGGQDFNGKKIKVCKLFSEIMDIAGAEEIQ